mmetsp:Transcript_33762/g.77447  ORF Transcript_33762/g.77447 Transcript_33762/m.77447 type:complete len:84 (+) Transcript_33762:334-585(+)
MQTLLFTVLGSSEIGARLCWLDAGRVSGGDSHVQLSCPPKDQAETTQLHASNSIISASAAACFRAGPITAPTKAPARTFAASV